MAIPKVYYCEGRRDDPDIGRKIRSLAEQAWFHHAGTPSDVLIKLHVGEFTKRNVHVRTHIELAMVGALAGFVESRGARRVLLTDSTPIYTGGRSTPDGHKRAAAEHGFTVAPFVVGDEQGDVTIEVDGFGKLDVPALNHRVAETGGAVLVATHFKGHPEMILGGAIKQLGMGCVGKAEKKRIHCAQVAVVDVGKCEGCEACVDVCGQGAVRVEGKAMIAAECVGCGLCAAVCPAGAVKMEDRQPGKDRRYLTLKYLVSAAKAVAEMFGPNVRYFTDLTKITPHCDCFEMQEPHDDLCSDVGFLAGSDPVAIDQACVDLIAARAGEGAFVDGMYRHFSKWQVSREHMASIVPYQLEYAEEIGLGQRRYELVEM